jgi:hypothetical protein
MFQYIFKLIFPKNITSTSFLLLADECRKRIFHFLFFSFLGLPLDKILYFTSAQVKYMNQGFKYSPHKVCSN